MLHRILLIVTRSHVAQRETFFSLLCCSVITLLKPCALSIQMAATSLKILTTRLGHAYIIWFYADGLFLCFVISFED